MIDVARLAGVSQQTVSRVLNGSTNVRPEVRQSVEEAVRQLRYRRNTAARALASSRSMTLGVLCYGLDYYGPSLALLGVEESARQAGYTTTLVTVSDTHLNSLSAAINHLIANSVDGIIVIAPVKGAQGALVALSDGIPAVIFEPAAEHGIASVALDEELGARLATRHLLELGHETVWQVCGDPGWTGTDARIRGWQSELAAARRVAPEPLPGNWTPASGYAAGLEIVKNREITAVFVASDHMAMGVLSALTDQGVSCPEEVSVVGFDDVPESRYYHPALTTVRMDFREVGRKCVARILNLIGGAETSQLEKIQPEHVVRASTAPPPRNGRGT
jgi:DNA-binding LacI/PurR family transcriptional regulator